jgi:hypothetical protein
LSNDRFWGVRYLILKKFLENINKWDISKYKDQLIKMRTDLKPQVRIITIQIMKHEKVQAWEPLLEMFYDKDPEVRKEVQTILESSQNPMVKAKMEDYKRKVKEKENKKKQLANMFEGI